MLQECTHNVPLRNKGIDQVTRLGSNAITTSSTGVKNSEIRYMPWGTTRYTSGSSPTTIQYTGQRVEASLGLLFYNARWYDPAAGRFLQADTIVPGAGNPQAFDRYTYTLNNPMKYVDPSGNGPESWGCGPDGIYCDNSVSFEEKYGITFTGSGWTDARKAAVKSGIKLVAGRLGGAMGTNSAFAWGQSYKNIEFEWNTQCYQCRTEETISRCGNNFEGSCAAGGAFTASSNHIIFASMSGENSQSYRMIKNVVHELGHVYDSLRGSSPSNDLDINHQEYINNRDLILQPNDPPDRWDWQQNMTKSPTETFADMFIAWTYNTWNNDPMNINYVTAAQNWMSKQMP